MDDRGTRRALFDGAAEDYRATRPGYPDALFDAIEARAPSRRPLSILEVGCGAGQATRGWAARGHRVLAVELGPRMAAVARRELADAPGVEIRTGAFEEADLPAGAFDLVFAASSFHWVEPGPGLAQAARILRDDGLFALCWNHQVAPLASLGAVYAAHAPALAASGAPRDPARRIGRHLEALLETGRFADARVDRWPWHRDFDAAGYARLLGTYSDHLALEPGDRRRLLRAVEERIAELGGTVRRDYVAVLLTARPA